MGVIDAPEANSSRQVPIGSYLWLYSLLDIPHWCFSNDEIADNGNRHAIIRT